MNKEQLQKQVEEMKLKLAEMEAELKKKEDVFPKVGDICWTICTDGDIRYSTFVNDRIDNLMINYGSIYKTKEDAVRARDIQLAKVRVTNRIKELNDGWTPDWNTTEQIKYYISLNTSTTKFWVDYMNNTKYLPSSMYMKSRQIAEQILSEMEDDIRLVLGE